MNFLTLLFKITTRAWDWNKIIRIEKTNSHKLSIIQEKAE